MSEENYMRIIDLRGKKLIRAEMLEAMPRAEMGTNEATELVQPILDDVKACGAAALRDFAEKFDHIRPENLRVPVAAMKAAVDELDPEVRAAIEESVRRSRAVSASQVPAPFHTDLSMPTMPDTMRLAVATKMLPGPVILSTGSHRISPSCGSEPLAP